MESAFESRHCEPKIEHIDALRAGLKELDQDDEYAPIRSQFRSREVMFLHSSASPVPVPGSELLPNKSDCELD